jgi:hypothetical protein
MRERGPALAAVGGASAPAMCSLSLATRTSELEFQGHASGYDDCYQQRCIRAHPVTVVQGLSSRFRRTSSLRKRSHSPGVGMHPLRGALDASWLGRRIQAHQLFPHERCIDRCVLSCPVVWHIKRTVSQTSRRSKRAGAMQARARRSSARASATVSLPPVREVCQRSDQIVMRVCASARSTSQTHVAMLPAAIALFVALLVSRGMPVLVRSSWLAALDARPARVESIAL